MASKPLKIRFNTAEELLKHLEGLEYAEKYFLSNPLIKADDRRPGQTFTTSSICFSDNEKDSAKAELNEVATFVTYGKRGTPIVGIHALPEVVNRAKELLEQKETAKRQEAVRLERIESQRTESAKHQPKANELAALIKEEFPDLGLGVQQDEGYRWVLVDHNAGDLPIQLITSYGNHIVEIGESLRSYQSVREKEIDIESVLNEAEKLAALNREAGLNVYIKKEASLCPEIDHSALNFPQIDAYTDKITISIDGKKSPSINLAADECRSTSAVIEKIRKEIDDYKRPIEAEAKKLADDVQGCFGLHGVLESTSEDSFNLGFSTTDYINIPNALVVNDMSIKVSDYSVAKAAKRMLEERGWEQANPDRQVSVEAFTKYILSRYPNGGDIEEIENDGSQYVVNGDIVLPGGQERGIIRTLRDQGFTAPTEPTVEKAAPEAASMPKPAIPKKPEIAAQQKGKTPAPPAEKAKKPPFVDRGLHKFTSGSNSPDPDNPFAALSALKEPDGTLTDSPMEGASVSEPAKQAVNDPRKVEIQNKWASIRQAHSDGVPVEELESMTEISNPEAKQLGIKPDALAKYRKHNTEREARLAEIEFEKERSVFIDEIGALNAANVDTGKAKDLFANAQKFKIAMPDDVIAHVDEGLDDTDLALGMLGYNEGMVSSEIAKGPARVVSGQTVSKGQKR